MKDELGVVILGSNIGKSHLECLCQLGSVDGTKVKVKAMAKHSQDWTKFVGSVKPEYLGGVELVSGRDSTHYVINQSSVDAVIVAVPDAEHFDYARFALEHGKHVLIEKPLTPDNAGGLRLVHLAGLNRLVLDTATQMRYHRAELDRVIISETDETQSPVTSLSITYRLPFKHEKNSVAHPLDNLLPHVLSLLPMPIMVVRSEYLGKYCLVSAKTEAGTRQGYMVNARVGYTKDVKAVPPLRLAEIHRGPKIAEFVFEAHQENGQYSESWFNPENRIPNPRVQLLRDFCKQVINPYQREQIYERVLAEHRALMVAKDRAGLRI
jgi:hypothetical protein